MTECGREAGRAQRAAAAAARPHKPALAAPSYLPAMALPAMAFARQNAVPSQHNPLRSPAHSTAHHELAGGHVQALLSCRRGHQQLAAGRLRGCGARRAQLNPKHTLGGCASSTRGLVRF